MWWNINLKFDKTRECRIDMFWIFWKRVVVIRIRSWISTNFHYVRSILCRFFFIANDVYWNFLRWHFECISCFFRFRFLFVFCSCSIQFLTCLTLMMIVYRIRCKRCVFWFDDSTLNSNCSKWFSLKWHFWNVFCILSCEYRCVC